MAANNEYVNRVDLGNETIIDLTNDTATESDVLAGQTFHLRSGAPGTGTLNAVTEIQPGDEDGQIKASQLVGVDYNVDLPGFGTAYGLDIYDNTLPIQFTHPGGAIADGIVYGNDEVGANKYGFVDNTKVDGSTTFTADGASGTITASGLPNSGSTFISNASTDTFEAGTYTFTGDIDASTTTYYMYVRTTGSSTTIANDYAENMQTFTLSEPTKLTVYCRLVSTNPEATHIFRPMICKQGETPSTFEPYQVGVGERTKNLLEITEESMTKNGVTFTVDKAAGIITVTNTATSAAQFDFAGDQKDIAGNIEDGMLLSNTNTTYTYVSIAYYTSGGTYISEQQATSSGRVLSIPENAGKYKFFCRRTTNDSGDTAVMHPMLRPADTTADFIPYGYQIPLDLRQNSYNELEITAETQTTNDVTFTVDKQAGTITANGTASGFARIIAGRWSGDGNSYIISGCPANGSDRTYAIQIYDDTASSWTEAKDFGNGAELESLEGHLYSVRIWAKTGTVCDNLIFRPMVRNMWYYDHKDLYIGLSPLTARHEPMHFYEADIDLIAEPGTSYLDTTLYNKPRVELVPYSGILNVIERIREDEVNKQNVSKVIWMGDADKTLDGTLFPDYIELDVDDVDDYQIIEFDFRAKTNSNNTTSWAKISLLNSDIKRWNSEFYSEDIFTDTNLQSATLCGLDGSGNVAYKNIAFQLQIDDYEKTIYYKFMYETDSVFGDYTITLRRIWGKKYES